MHYCFRTSPCNRFNSNFIMASYSSPKPFLFLIHKQTTVSEVTLVNARSTVTHYVFYLVKPFLNVCNEFTLGLI